VCQIDVGAWEVERKIVGGSPVDRFSGRKGRIAEGCAGRRTASVVVLVVSKVNKSNPI